jgi:hypothetical protein
MCCRYQYAMGATLSLTSVNATAKLVNCSIDAARSSAVTGRKPSEIYLAETGQRLNLTFTNVTSCHTDTLFIEPDKLDRKVTLRGSNFCTDGTYATDTVNAHAADVIEGCDADAWQCGQHAACAPTSTVGIACTCGVVAGHGQKWGYAYGGDPSVIANSSGFDGCFEQWDASLASLSSSHCSAITPGLDPTLSEYACCTLRDAAHHAAPVAVVINTSLYGDRPRLTHGTRAPRSHSLPLWLCAPCTYSHSTTHPTSTHPTSARPPPPACMCCRRQSLK